MVHSGIGKYFCYMNTVICCIFELFLHEYIFIGILCTYYQKLC